MIGKEAGDLRSIEITDHSLASAPVVSITIFRNEIPPEIAFGSLVRVAPYPGCLFGPPSPQLPKCSERTRWNSDRIDQLAASHPHKSFHCELNRSTIKQSIQEGSISRDPEFVTDARDTSGDAEIVVG